jgi:hypothetical protein
VAEGFGYVVCSIEDSKNVSTFTIDELHEQRTRRNKEEDHALKVTNGGKEDNLSNKSSMSAISFPS